MKRALQYIHHLGYLSAGFLIYFAIFFDVLVRGNGTLVRGFDGSVQSFAWLSKLARDWSALEPPLWDLTSFSGTSFIGEIQTGVLYPGNMILAWFSPSLTQHSLDVYIVLHYILAFYFMALFLRESRFNLAATLAGAYAFASYLDWVQPHRFVGMVYLPLVLLFFVKALKQKKSVILNSWLYLSGIFLGLMILAGHIQPYLHSTIALLFFVVILDWAPNFSTSRLLFLTKRLLLVGFISALFSAPQWLLTLEHFSQSYRWAPGRTEGLTRIPYEVYGFVDVLAPELLTYLIHSWIPIALGIALITAVVGKGPLRRFALFGIVLLLFAALSGLGDRGYLSRITYHVPLLNSAREATRYIFLILFASSMLLAVSIQSLCSGIAWLRGRKPGIDPDFSLPGIGSNKGWIQIVVIFALAVPLWVHSSVFLRIQDNDDDLSPVQLYRRGKIIEFLEEAQNDQSQSFRVFNFKQCMAPNLGNAFDLLTIRGHRATILKSYFDFFSNTLDDPLDPRLAILGVKYVISPEKLDGLTLILQEGSLYLYERSDAFPLLHWYEAETEKRTPALLEKTSFSANSLSVSLGSTTPGRLFFSQPFFPGWQVRVDGEVRKIVQTGIFMGVEIRSGDKNVEFRYRPWQIWLGLAAILLSLAMLAGSLLVRTNSDLPLIYNSR